MEVFMKKSVFTFFVLSLFSLSVFAQEGMWLLSQIDQLDLKNKGLEIETSEIYNPDKPALYQAVLQLGGGSASFVSPDGLIITNHHVAFGALQRASSVENDYISEGFLANARTEEIRAEGYQARLLTDMTDVTDKIMKATKGIEDPAERDKKVKEKIGKMTEAIEKKGDDVDVYIAEMYNGRQYIQFVYKVFKDIRIVYAPPSSIGNYGGDIDNWMWPRHTGDFSFMRAYAAPDGTGAEYSKENVPYNPDVWLKVATEELDEGDFTFILGFPGATTRYRTSNSAAWNLKYNYPFSIQVFGDILDIMHELTAEDQEGRIKVASMESGLANAMKNYQGKVDGMKKVNFVQKKKDFEKEFTSWINSSNVYKDKYGHILPDIEKTYALIEPTKDRDNVLGMMGGLGGTPYSIARQLYSMKKELEKPEKERKPGYSEKVLEKMKSQLPYYFANYYEPVDKAMFAYMLKLVHDLPEGQKIKELDYIFRSDKSMDEIANKAYASTGLKDPEYIESLLDKSLKEIVALEDPFIKMAASTWELEQEYDKVYTKFAPQVTDLRKEYIDALYAWKGSNLYPDANGTLRFTSGNVMGYSPENAVWYKPFTSLEGVVAKDTGAEPFDAPEALKKLYEKKDFGQWADPDLDDVPVAFTHQCDITGGNSGSPVMNAKGEIIGVAFDGNYEAMIGDWQYDYDLQRTISVDIRYCLFITEKFGKAEYILEEMGVSGADFGSKTKE
jgi:hypothetical protein